MAQLGRALRSGRRGRVFESRHSDWLQGWRHKGLQISAVSFFLMKIPIIKNFVKNFFVTGDTGG